LLIAFPLSIDSPIVNRDACVYLARTLSGETRIQLCGPLIFRIEGDDVTERVSGRKGRLLFAYLCTNRLRPVPRSELIEAFWRDQAPGSSDRLLDPVVSRLRSVIGAERLTGRGELRLVLPGDAYVDTEAASEAIHRAEGAVRRGDWAAAWGPARVALHVTNRAFLPGDEGAWIDEIRREHEDVRLRAHECVAASGLGLGGAELDSAKRSGRALVKLAPHRESGYRLLMETLASEGNVAEALDVYETLRHVMQVELGVAPSPASRQLHRRLLDSDLEQAE
jgi:DNA-binding SARP family transcriptional activator